MPRNLTSRVNILPEHGMIVLTSAHLNLSEGALFMSSKENKITESSKFQKQMPHLFSIHDRNLAPSDIFKRAQVSTMK